VGLGFADVRFLKLLLELAGLLMTQVHRMSWACLPILGNCFNLQEESRRPPGYEDPKVHLRFLSVLAQAASSCGC
jgi:hypothetical protein